MADCVGSLQAVERMTVGFEVSTGHDGLGPGQIGSFAWAGAKQCHVWQKCMKTWHFVSTGQQLAFFPFKSTLL